MSLRYRFCLIAATTLVALAPPGCKRKMTVEYRFVANEPAVVHLNGVAVGDAPLTLSIEELSQHFEPEWQAATASVAAVAAALDEHRSNGAGTWGKGQHGENVEYRMTQGDDMVCLMRHGVAYAGGFRVKLVAPDGTVLRHAGSSGQGEGDSLTRSYRKVHSFERR